MCREFCDSTFENEGNSLRTYQSDQSGSSQKTCVCEVGSGRIAEYPNKAGILKRTLPSMSGSRRLLTDDTDDTDDGHIPLSRPPSRPPPAPPPNVDTPPDWAHPCNRTSDCVANFSNVKLCKSLWGTATPCYACIERDMPGLAYSRCSRRKPQTWTSRPKRRRRAPPPRP